ncbi:MFS transporter [Actinomadura rubrisoli]|uniref:MFS transporter n=1 Tax=Actinomadura rubrisoli TaxID=2530368 RepID=UPI001A9EB762|nr:MFS transporter [Actinomadura rubrisoli]
MGSDFTRLWTAYTVSAVGSAVATHAFTLVAAIALSSNALQVSLLSALGGAIGALLALPVGPWIEFRRKRPIMIAADLTRFCALVTVPVAYTAGALTYLHLVVVCVLVAVCQIVFAGASGAHLKSFVARDHLIEANARFESVLWTSTTVGPPVGGLLIAVFGPTVTVMADAVSYLLSAIGIRSIATPEPEPQPRTTDHRWWRGLGEGWRHIWSDTALRLLFINTVVVSTLITAITPILAVMMLQDLHFSAFQYGLSVGVPCAAGVVGARLSRRIVAGRGPRTVLLTAGVARVLWLPWLPFVGPGWLGLAAVAAIHSGTVFFMSVFSPVFATHRLENTPSHELARVLTSWTISSNAARAVCTLAWGLLATVTTPRFAIAVAVMLLLATCACLPWKPFKAPRKAAANGPNPSGEQDGPFHNR